jgi:Fe-S-cluster-containing dehydrogenase component
MPQYGFVIDHRKCIGCHACTVACKAENEVPLGNFRTWVKYTEKGTFPSVRRHFTVLRCNHCDAAPCVDICPVNALHKRPDAIVDLDRDLCIGCRACMQACPYDALYLNEDRGVAEKCHYCAHRTEVGLEPACVTVCPEQAIVAGDVSDPDTPITILIREEDVQRRKLDKGTKPRVWYIDALPESLQPTVPRDPSTYLWSDRAANDVPMPIVPGYEPTPDITTTLDVPHPPAWGWHVWTYLVTKNIAAGAALVAPFLTTIDEHAASEWFPSLRAAAIAPEVVALLFLALTNVLLIHDLGRPERFWRILFAPNTKSWLVRGAWVLTAFGLVTTAVVLARWFGLDRVADELRWLNVPLAVLTAGYSAWLFAQCRGRDLWLDRWLFARLVVRAGLCGTAVGAGIGVLYGHVPMGLTIAMAALAACEWVSANWIPHGNASREAQIAAGSLHADENSRHGSHMLLAVMALAAFSSLTDGARFLAVSAGAMAIVVLFFHERAWIRAGQSVPLS